MSFPSSLESTSGEQTANRRLTHLHTERPNLPILDFFSSLASNLLYPLIRRCHIPLRPPSIDSQQLDVLRQIDSHLQSAAHLDSIFQDALLKSLCQISSQLSTLADLLREIASDLSPEPATASIANRFTGDSPMADNALVFTVGQTSIDTITPLLADGTTPSGGVVSGVAVTFTDPSATFVINADQTVTWTAVSASTGPVSGSVACTVTDTDGAVSTWNQGFTIQTNGVVPPAQRTQSIVNRFSAPTP